LFVEVFGYWFHLSAVDLPWRVLLARTLVTSGGVWAFRTSRSLFLISPWERRADQLLPKRCVLRKKRFMPDPLPSTAKDEASQLAEPLANLLRRYQATLLLG